MEYAHLKLSGILGRGAARSFSHQHTRSNPPPFHSQPFMYLPQWVVAAIAVFNAASDQPGDSTIAPTYWRPGPAVNGDEFVGVFMQTGVVLHHLSAKPEQGAVAVMYAPPVPLRRSLVDQVGPKRKTSNPLHSGTSHTPRKEEASSCGCRTSPTCVSRQRPVSSGPHHWSGGYSI